MSNSLAIAAVTATLRNLLIRGIGIQDVTARPLDFARQNTTGNQVNLFLYQVLPDAAFRNQEMPRQLKPGETGYPPLPLTLYYLLTAYSDEEDDTSAHRLLGQAMSVLHDHPLLGAEEIRNATAPITDLNGSDLHDQIERVRITLQPLMFEEMSKLWTTFQTHYRISAAYQVSVVLIESLLPPKAPLPVLQRGQGDRGVTSQADPIPPFPALISAQLPERRLSAAPGDLVILNGSRLSGGAASLASHRFDDPPQPATAAVDDTRLDVTLPAGLSPGFYTIAVRLNTPQGEISSNELPLAVAPVITTPLPLTVARAGGQAVIDLESSATALPAQRVSLILGDYEAQAEPRAAVTNSFRFIIKELADGDFPTPTGVGLLARLRVDGVDSEILAPRQPNEPENAPINFDENKKITIN
jgi:hypothetical protein